VISRTGAQLLTGLSRFLGDEISVSGLTMSSNGTSTTVVDTELSSYGDDFFRDWWIRDTSSTNQWVFRRVSSFTSASGTLTTVNTWGSTPQSGDTYELHRFRPDGMFSALDDARVSVYPDLAILRFDDTITTDGISKSYDIPSNVRRGPATVLLEQPVAVDVSWNFLTAPTGDSTSNYTASNFTASTYAREEADRLIPKYDDTATELVLAASTAGTYRQVVANMANNITAAKSAGRRMTAAAWVYCRSASKIALEFLDDSGQVAASSQHGGTGWELLTATGNVVGTNATTLTWGLTADNDATPIDVFWNRAWFYYGEAGRVRDVYAQVQPKRVRRDGTPPATLHFLGIPPRGRQVRLIGRDHLSELGTTAGTQVTNTMELDAADEQILLAEAAKILFLREGMSTNDFPSLSTKIAIAEARRVDMAKKWGMNVPTQQAITSPWR